MSEEQRGTIGEGIKTGIGILTAFKEAVEETLDEALERGDLSPDRARGAVREAAQRMQLSIEEARDRLDLVSRRDLDALRMELKDLRERVDRLEGKGDPAAAAEDVDRLAAADISIPVD